MAAVGCPNEAAAAWRTRRDLPDGEHQRLNLNVLRCTSTALLYYLISTFNLGFQVKLHVSISSFYGFHKVVVVRLWFVSLDAVRFSIGNDNGADNNNPTRAVLSRITVTLGFSALGRRGAGRWGCKICGRKSLFLSTLDVNIGAKCGNFHRNMLFMQSPFLSLSMGLNVVHSPA